MKSIVGMGISASGTEEEAPTGDLAVDCQKRRVETAGASKGANCDEHRCRHKYLLAAF